MLLCVSFELCQIAPKIQLDSLFISNFCFGSKIKEREREREREDEHYTRVESSITCQLHDGIPRHTLKKETRVAIYRRAGLYAGITDVATHSS